MNISSYLLIILSILASCDHLSRDEGAARQELSTQDQRSKKVVILQDGRTVQGYQVVFDYTGYTRERELAYQYFQGEWGKDWPFVFEDVGVDFYDLDNDGEM